MTTPPFHRLAGPHFSRSLLLLLLASMLITVSTGCSGLARRNEYVVETPPMPYKRVPKWEATDWVHRWRSQAFRAQKPVPASVAPAQRIMLKEYGNPDYTRVYSADHKEKVTEWVYLDEDQLVQFVDGNVVYSGPVTDIEKLLIDRGYPDEMSRVANMIGPERKQYIYWNWSHTKPEIYSFSDGYLAEMIE